MSQTQSSPSFHWTCSTFKQKEMPVRTITGCLTICIVLGFHQWFAFKFIEHQRFFVLSFIEFPLLRQVEGRSMARIHISINTGGNIDITRETRLEWENSLLYLHLETGNVCHLLVFSCMSCVSHASVTIWHHNYLSLKWDNSLLYLHLETRNVCHLLVSRMSYACHDVSDHPSGTMMPSDLIPPTHLSPLPVIINSTTHQNHQWATPQKTLSLLGHRFSSLSPFHEPFCLQPVVPILTKQQAH